MPTRTRQECQARWEDTLLFRQSCALLEWGAEEDELLQRIVKITSASNWDAVASLYNLKRQGGIRTAKECRERWAEHLQWNMPKREEYLRS